MPQSLANVLIHLVFSTKHRQPFLKDESLRGELHAYAITVLKSLDSPSLAINSVEDHIHILCQLSRKIAIAELVETLKTSTSKWLKTKDRSLKQFHWQAGYAAFSVSESTRPEVMRYIDRQQEHHRRLTYQDEFRQLCVRNAIKIDERYVWD
jgi:REP element-mobilizing transposase RayT